MFYLDVADVLDRQGLYDAAEDYIIKAMIEKKKW